MNLKVYTDGGARGNPGIAGIGVYITDEKGIPVEKRYKSLGIKTNNQAEYLGALNGIKRAIELGATQIELNMDSELVVKQLKGEFKIKNPELKEIQKEIAEILTPWTGLLKIQHIPRTKNKEADRLSNVAMDRNECG